MKIKQYKKNGGKSGRRECVTAAKKNGKSSENDTFSVATRRLRRRGQLNKFIFPFRFGCVVLVYYFQFFFLLSHSVVVIHFFSLMGNIHIRPLLYFDLFSSLFLLFKKEDRMSEREINCL